MLFELLPSNCLNWKIYCDDHSSLCFFCSICWLIGKRTLSPWVENGIQFATTRKTAKRKTKISKVCNLKLRLFENHTVVAKVISLFVEKKLPLEYLFLIERSCWTKGFLQKEMIFVRATFLVEGKPSNKRIFKPQGLEIK